MIWKSWMMLCLCGALAGPLYAKASLTLYVATDGRDTWSGRLAAPNTAGTDGPLATIGHARDVLRTLRAAGKLKGAAEVQVRRGSYYLTEPLLFTPQDSGTEKAPVSYRAYPGETPEISGGQRITGWRQDRVNGQPCWVADLPEVAAGQWYFTQLFVNGRRCPRPRLPKDGYYRFAGVPDPPVTPNPRKNGPLVASFFGTDLQPWRNLSDVEIVTLQYWDDMHVYPTQVDTEKRLVTFFARGASLVDETNQFSRYYVNNVFEALDTPGQWYLERSTGKLYYLPLPGEQPETTTVVAPRLATLVRFQGEAQQRVAHIRLEGLAFHHTEWTYARTKAGDTQAANSVPGAILFSNADHCALFRCDIAQIGQYAIEMAQGSVGNRVIACTLQDLGAGGVKISAETEHTEVADCKIAHGGRVYPSAIGVLVKNSGYNRVHHNLIYDFFYTGISCGWTWGYAPTATVDNRIEYNHIYDIGQGLLSDMGGIYTLGKQPGSIIRGNVVHDIAKYNYGGWGIYNDEGSSGILVEGNLTYRTGTSGYNMHYGRDVLVRNNIFALSREANIGRGRQEAHRSFAFMHNIVYWNETHKMFDGYSNKPNWPHMSFADNLYWNAAKASDVNFDGLSLAKWQALGNDRGSRIADPQFVDAAAGDFRLRPSSPALAMGFTPIDVRRAGPRQLTAARLDAWPTYAEQAGPILDARLELAGNDAFAIDARGTVRLVVRNLGTATARGTYTLAPEVPGSIRVAGSPTMRVTLRPGAEMRREFSVEIIGSMKEAALVATPSGDAVIPTCIYLPNTRETRWDIPRRAAVATPEELPAALAAIPARPLRWLGQRMVETKIAVAGDALAVQATIYDHQIRRLPERPWDASSLELFFAPIDSKQITQLVFAPATDDVPAAVWCYRGGKPLETPPLRYTMRPAPGGYELLLLCPLSDLGLASDVRVFLLEMNVNTTATGGQHIINQRLFESMSPYNNTENYGHLVVQE